MQIVKKILIGFTFFAFALSGSAAEAKSLDFDCGGAANITALEVASSPIPEVSVPGATEKVSGQAAQTTIYVAEFNAKTEAEAALPGIVRKLEASGCVVLWSKVDSDSYGRNVWEVRLSYLAPAGLTIEIYNSESPSFSIAAQALPDMIRKLENAGYVVLNSWTSATTDAVNSPHYLSGVSFISPVGTKVQTYSAGFNALSEANIALPGLVKKFENAGYAVINTWTGPSGYGNWHAGLAYITPR